MNKLVWSRDGRMLYVGDAKGCVHMIGVHDSMVKASPAEENVFELTLLRTSAKDKDKETLLSSS